MGRRNAASFIRCSEHRFLMISFTLEFKYRAEGWGLDLWEPLKDLWRMDTGHTVGQAQPRLKPRPRSSIWDFCLQVTSLGV